MPKSSFFPELTHHKEFFTKNGVERLYDKGNQLVRADEPSPHVFFLTDGLVKVSFCTHSGSERILGYFLPGITFAQSGSFFNSPDGNLSYVAITKSSAYTVSREVFLQQLKDDHAFNDDYIKSLLRNQQFLIDRVIYQGEHSFEQKCIKWLLFMVRYYGTLSDNVCTIPVPISQEVVANFLHASRESVNKAMSDLRKQGVIDKKNNKIRICDYKKLNKLAKS